MTRKYYKVENRRNFYKKYFSIQNGCCELCGKKERLVIDHDHKTGLMRSLLCYKHNMALGMFNEDVELLRRAADYLEKHNVGSDPETVLYIENFENRKKTDDSFCSKETIHEFLDDLSYPSERARARALAERTGLLPETAYSRLRRASLKRKEILVTESVPHTDA